MMQELESAYSTLFAHDGRPIASPPLQLREYTRILLHKPLRDGHTRRKSLVTSQRQYEGWSEVLLQLSLYRALFAKHYSPAALRLSPRMTQRCEVVPKTTSSSVSACDTSQSNSEYQESVFLSVAVERKDNCSIESLRLNVCKSLLAESISVIQILMHYFGSNNQFVSFSASKAVTSFLLYISNVESIKTELLKTVNTLISLETCQTHVSVYILQTFTDVLKGVRNSCNTIQGSSTTSSEISALWEVVVDAIKQSLQVLSECKCLQETKEEEKKERDEGLAKRQIKWIELTVDAFLSLLIETLRHCRTSHMTESTKPQQLICHNLSQITSLLDTSQSVYVLKQLIHLHLKLITNSSLLEDIDIHCSMLNLLQSDVFITTAQEWLSTVADYDKARASESSKVSNTLPGIPLQSANEQGLTLESSLVCTVIRKAVLLLLNYSVIVLTPNSKDIQSASTDCLHLEKLLSSLSPLLHQSVIREPSLWSMCSARLHLLELLSEQDACLLEGLMLSYNINVSLRQSSLSLSPDDHPTLIACLNVLSIHHLFSDFLSSFIFFDHSLLIDYFISPETSSIFRQFLSQYLSLAIKEWTLLTQVCTESDRCNEMLLAKSVPNIKSTFELNNKDATNDMQDSLTSYEDYCTTAKRPKLDLVDSSSSQEECITHAEKTDLSDSDISETLSFDVSANISEVSNCENEMEKDSDLVYKETCLDKIMDCLTQFKYSLKRLHSSQLLQAALGEDLHDSISSFSCSVEGTVGLLERLEELYEAMAK